MNVSSNRYRAMAATVCIGLMAAIAGCGGPDTVTKTTTERTTTSSPSQATTTVTTTQKQEIER